MTFRPQIFAKEKFLAAVAFHCPCSALAVSLPNNLNSQPIANRNRVYLNGTSKASPHPITITD